MIELSQIIIDENYATKWNTSGRDFIVLTNNGEPINKHLYRKGMFNNKIKDYFMLFKMVEAYYPDSITKNKKAKLHLEDRSVILNKDGIEKVEFSSFQHPYLVDNSCIYSLDQNYYNIETGELYCNSFTSMISLEYLFLDNRYDKDPNKCGVMKINKKDGSWELFK